MRYMADLDTYIINPLIEHYIDDLYGFADNTVLREMEILAQQQQFPIIGPQVGRFLYQITKISGAKKIFELGSGYGYSAYWFASALGKDGSMICTDKSEDNCNIAREIFSKSLPDIKIEFLSGDSIEILSRQTDKFDIILNDIDKEQYPDVIKLAEKKLVKGGILITDNVLWSGRIITDDDSISTEGVRKFNKDIFNNENFVTSLLPIRDGIALSLKI